MTWHCQPRFESLCFLGVVLFHGMESSYTATFDVGFIVVEPAMDGYVCYLGLWQVGTCDRITSLRPAAGLIRRRWLEQ